MSSWIGQRQRPSEPTFPADRATTATTAAAVAAAAAESLTVIREGEDVVTTKSTPESPSSAAAAAAAPRAASSHRRQTTRRYDRSSTQLLDLIERATGGSRQGASRSHHKNIIDSDDDDDEFEFDDDEDDSSLMGVIMCDDDDTPPPPAPPPPPPSSSPIAVMTSPSGYHQTESLDSASSGSDDYYDDDGYDGDKLLKYHKQQQTQLYHSTTLQQGDEDQEAFFLSKDKKKQQKKKKHQHDSSDRKRPQRFKVKEMDVERYMASREMTPLQERMNAVTVMPGAFYCIMLLLSGSWLPKSLIEEEMTAMSDAAHVAGSAAVVVFVDDSQCLSWRWMPNMHALPPLPLVAAAVGIIFHAPFSFIYHWKYAHRLPAGLPRTTHWSRRMDQAMIHVCSGTMAYGTSGRVDFFLANALFNTDCIYRQFKKVVRPRRNQTRIFISVVAYTIPIVRRGDLTLFARIWALFAISGWLFSKYPIGGWSHSVFHIVMAFVPPLLMAAAVELPASQPQLKVAAQCAVMAQSGLLSLAQ